MKASKRYPEHIILTSGYNYEKCVHAFQHAFLNQSYIPRSCASKLDLYRITISIKYNIVVRPQKCVTRLGTVVCSEVTWRAHFRGFSHFTTYNFENSRQNVMFVLPGSKSHVHVNYTGMIRADPTICYFACMESTNINYVNMGCF